MLTETQLVNLIEVMYEKMDDSSIRELVLDRLFEYYSDADTEELETLYKEHVTGD